MRFWTLCATVIFLNCNTHGSFEALCYQVERVQEIEQLMPMGNEFFLPLRRAKSDSLHSNSTLWLQACHVANHRVGLKEGQKFQLDSLLWILSNEWDATKWGGSFYTEYTIVKLQRFETYIIITLTDDDCPGTNCDRLFNLIIDQQNQKLYPIRNYGRPMFPIYFRSQLYLLKTENILPDGISENTENISVLKFTGSTLVQYKGIKYIPKIKD